RSIPGVISVGEGFVSPLSGDFATGRIQVPEYAPKPNEIDLIAINPVGPNYFRTLGTRLAAGRQFTEADGREQKVAIVNERTSAHYWPGESAVGKRIALNVGRLKDEFEIVGVVQDEKAESLREDPKPAIYIPFRLGFAANMSLHARIAGDARPV